MDEFYETLKFFFQVVVKRQTYLNILYLLLSFPLGTAYFTFLITGITLGVGMLFIWVGFVILLFLFASWWLLLVFERQLAIGLLRIEIPPLTRQGLKVKGLGKTFIAYVTNPVTWKGLLYLLVKFPLGVINFIISVTALATSTALLTAPLTYRFIPLQIGFAWNSAWQINTFPEALVAFVIGVILLVSTFHLENGLAWISGQFARLMLANRQEPVPGPVPKDEGWPRFDPTSIAKDSKAP
jgi:Putative sensor